MANIRSYEAPSGLGLNPTETGVESLAAVGRRVGAFGNQIADTYNQEGSEAKGAIVDAGDVAVSQIDHRQISSGAAAFSQLQLGLTQQWNEIAKKADPNDPSVAAKFQEEVVKPALNDFQSGFTTENSQRFAEQKTDALRQHMQEKTGADMSSLAKIAVGKNINDATTAMSNTAITDPSSVPNLLAGVDHSIAAVVSSSPTLNAVDAARATSELSDQTKKAIVQSGAIGAIQKSGNPEATADEWIKKYPDYISGPEAKTLAGNARQQIRSQNYDYELNRRRQKEVATDNSNAKVDQYLVDVRSQDPKLANDPTAKTILNDRTLLPAAKNNLLNYIDRQLKPETETRLSQQSFVGLLRDLRAPDADPDAVMQKAWDARLMDPGKPGSMSEKDFNQFRAEVVARKTPEGAALEHDRADFIKNYAPSIVGPSYAPGVGDPKLYNAEMDARRVETDLKRKGLDPHLAYDPSSPYFLGKPDRISKWQSSMQQDLSDKSTNAPAAPPDEKPPLPDARKAPDGNWYTEKDGKYFRVEKLSDGASGFREAENGGSMTGDAYGNFRRSDDIEDRRHESAAARQGGRQESGYSEHDLSPTEKTALSKMLGADSLTTDNEKYRERKQKLFDDLAHTIREFRKAGSDLPLPQRGRPYIQKRDE